MLFSVDPHGAFKIMPFPSFNILLNIPIVLWIIGAYLIALYWLELQKTMTGTTSVLNCESSQAQLIYCSGVTEMMTINKFRPVLIAGVVICTVLVIPSGIG